MQSQQDHQLEENNPEIERMKTLVYQKQFYQSNEKVREIRYRSTKGRCCFWHIIGAPQKDGHDMSLLPYQLTRV
jgi:hypothetical protein